MEYSGRCVLFGGLFACLVCLGIGVVIGYFAKPDPAPPEMEQCPKPTGSPLPSTSAMSQISVSSNNSLTALPATQFNDPKTHPMGLIVMQEWWGVNQDIKDVAKDLAMRGNFTTLVPDLYRGGVAKDFEEAGHLSGSLDWVGAREDIQACARHLLAQGCTKVGVTGFCMGGGLSLMAAEQVPELSAAAPFYGIPTPNRADVRNIKIPVQCHYGKTDVVIDYDTKVAELEQLFKDGGVQYEIYGYEAGHGFANPSSRGYNKEEAEKAITRLVAFFQQNLK